MSRIPSPSWTPRNGMVLGVAVMLGIAAALVAMHHLQQREKEIELRATQEMTDAVVPKEDLAAGTTLDHDRVAVRKVPLQWLHAEAISPEQFDQVSQSVLAYPVRRGEPLLWSQISQRQSSPFAALVHGGRRAVTVPVDEVNALSGLLAPGDMIDLLLTVRGPHGNTTLGLLQGVRVLATGSEIAARPASAGRSERNFSTITLDVSPEEGRRIVAARTVGTLTAMLRAPGDRHIQPIVAADTLTLLGLSSPARRQEKTIPVIYGGMNQQQLEAKLSMSSSRGLYERIEAENQVPVIGVGADPEHDSSVPAARPLATVIDPR